MTSSDMTLVRESRNRLRLPWRVQRRLRRSYYVKHLTQLVFRSVLRTPPVHAGEDSTVEVMSLLDKGNLRNYLLALKSLFLFSGTSPAVTVLSDGSLEAEDVNILRHHVRGIRVWRKEEIEYPSSSAAQVERWCHEYPYLAKLMYLPFVSRKPVLLFLDSDVLFRAPVSDSFFRLRDGEAVNYARDHDHSQYDKYFYCVEEYARQRELPLPRDLNCGLMLWNRDRLQPLDSLEFLEYVVRRVGFLYPVAEQDAWAVLAARTTFSALPADYLVLSNWEMNDREHRQNALATHYVSADRYTRFDYLRDGWSVIQALRAGEKPR